MFGQEDKKGSSVDDVASANQETAMGKEKKNTLHLWKWVLSAV